MEVGDAGAGGTGSGRRYPGVSASREAPGNRPPLGPARQWFPPCPFPCGVMVPVQTLPVSSLEMASETLVAMVILNSSDSDVALLWQPYPQPLGGSAGTIFFFYFFFLS